MKKYIKQYVNHCCREPWLAALNTVGCMVIGLAFPIVGLVVLAIIYEAVVNFSLVGLLEILILTSKVVLSVVVIVLFFYGFARLICWVGCKLGLKDEL